MLEAKKTDFDKKKDDENKDGNGADGKPVPRPKILNKNILRLQFKIK